MTSITIKGLEKLTRIADKYPAIAERFVGEAIVESIANVQRESFPFTPVKTNRLLSDLRVPHFGRFFGSFGSNLPYAGFVHDKYKKGVAYENPSLNKNAVAGFLSMGADASKSKVKELINNAIEKTLNALAK